MAREMEMPNVNSEIKDLRDRVERLEREARRTTRGSTNQRGAAEYLHKSREYLRQLHLRGQGPLRNPDGTYSYDNLDLFQEKGIA
jgi:hypothetical protein